MDISELDIKTLVERFYAAAREDAVLGPIFEAHVEDWPRHLTRMNEFWLTVATGTPAYKGTPMVAHLRLDAIEPAHFEHWLGIFRATTAALFEPPKAEHFNSRAARIAESLKLGIHFKRGELS